MIEFSPITKKLIELSELKGILFERTSEDVSEIINKQIDFGEQKLINH